MYSNHQDAVTASHLDMMQPSIKTSSSTAATVTSNAMWSLRSDCDEGSNFLRLPSEILMPEQLREPSVASGVQSLIAKEYPQTDEDCNLVDHFLAIKMNEMDLFEKEKGNFELHGLPSDQDPGQALMEECLRELDVEIGKISIKTAYEEAMQQNAEYVTNRNFRLMFLRCDRFDVKAAAQKMVWHFEVKRSLFGPLNLGRDIHLSDMNADDMEAFASGVAQILPERDPAGRSVFMIFPKLRNNSKGQIIKADSFVRVLWYLMFSLSSQVENQKKGNVCIVYNVGIEKRVSFPLLSALRRAKHGVPRKVTGIHICYDNWWLRPFVLAQKLYALDAAARLRMKDHHGSHQECIFALSTFGIMLNNPSRDPLILPDGTVSLECHRKWLQERRTIELGMGANLLTVMREEETIVPRRFDVLHGRGSKYAKHTGNMRLVHLCNMKLESYNAANKYQKTEIADRVVSIVHESFGRFLRFDANEGCWVEVEREASREKVSHIFRHLRKKQEETVHHKIEARKRGSEASPQMPSATNDLKKSCT